MSKQEIEVLKSQLVKSISPLRIYLFGSAAEENDTEKSDFDFYIVVEDEVTDLADVTAKAYRSIRRIKQRPVDIIVSSNSRFEARKQFPSLEREVAEKGVLLYGV